MIAQIASSSAYAQVREVKKGDLVAEDGYLVSQEDFNLLVSSCERAERDRDSFREAWNECNDLLREPPPEPVSEWTWLTLGFAGGVTVTLIAVIAVVR